MALQKAYNLSWSGKTIDGSEVNEISWMTSGDISSAFEIKVVKNSDFTLVWSLPKTNSYAQKYIIPANSLANGEEYKIQIITYNEQNQSIASDYVVFQTSSRPVVSVSPIGIVNAPTFNFSATYSQVESVPMNNWSVYLYNSQMKEIASSKLNTSSLIEYLVSNLESEKEYYIEFQATSAKGLTGTTGKIQFSVLYTQPKVFVNLTAENIPEKAGVEIKWNVIQIIGKSLCSPLTYIDNDKVDLTGGCSVYFEEGFSVDNDFLLKIWLENPISKSDLLILKGVNGTVRLQFNATKECFYLYKDVGNITSSWMSQQVSNGKYFVAIVQKGTELGVIAEDVNT